MYSTFYKDKPHPNYPWYIMSGSNPIMRAAWDRLAMIYAQQLIDGEVE